MSITKPYGYAFPEHVMPVDLAMYAPISPSTPRSSTELLRLSPPSPTSSLSSSSSGNSLSSYSPGTGTLQKKKQVVFADAKGLTLEFIRYFTVDPLKMETEDRPQEEERVKARASMQNVRPRVKLGFPQPAADRASLKETLVQLESCSVKEKLLHGTVRVYNIMYDKTVYVRITFDSWRSYKNIPCTYIREPYGTLETDLFAFSIPLPSDLDPMELMEFFVVYRSGTSKKQSVDNNKGKNYQIFVENLVPEPRLVALEHHLKPSVPRLMSSEHRPLSSEFRRPLLEPRLVASEFRQLPLEPRPVVSSHRSFVTPSPQRSSAWPAVRVLDPQTKYLTCRGPPYTDRLVNRSMKMTNVPQLC